MFKKDPTMITVVHKDDIHFLADGINNDELKIHHSISLDQFLKEDAGVETIPEDIRARTNTLLIVSDYWFGNKSFKFQSKKKALAKEFIERKLAAEYPDLPDIGYFFDYDFDKVEEDSQGLYVCFLQESKFFNLYEQLAKFNLGPRQITAPAFIWAQRLKKAVPDFHKGGKGLVHLMSSECFLYFFFQGRYLFSRNIAIPDYQEKANDNLDILTYEINQSIYLFSQKTRAEISRFYLAAADIINAGELSDLIGREVIDLDSLDKRLGIDPAMEASLGPSGVFNSDDFSLSMSSPGIIHRHLREELKWRPVQAMGILIGLIVLLLLGSETVFLWRWSQQDRSQAESSLTVNDAVSKIAIQKINDAFDLLLADTDHPLPSQVIINTARSLPDNAWIREMDIDIETNPGVDIKGVIKAGSAEQFGDLLSDFVDSLNKNTQCPRPVTINDMKFDLEETGIGQGYQDYMISLRLDLP